MWFYGALPLAGVTLQAALLTSNGIQVTPGSFTGANHTVLLSGSESAVENGTLVHVESCQLVAGVQSAHSISSGTGTLGVQINEDVQLNGSSTSGEQGGFVVSHICAAGGSEIVTGIQSFAGVTNTPTTITNLTIACGAGTLVVDGPPVTVNINAGEMEVIGETGFLIQGSPLTTLVSATEAGSMVAFPTVDVLLNGLGMTSAQHVVAANQDVEDTHIVSFIGTALVDMRLALTGVEIAGLQGSVAATVDLTLALSGTEDVAEAGSVTLSMDFQLTGTQVLCEQDFLGGWPVTRELSGAESLAEAGTVFLDNDRAFPLLGQQVICTSDFTLLYNALVPITNVLILSEQYLFEAHAELTGIDCEVGQGRLEEASQGKGAGDPGKGKGRGKPRKTVIVDGQTFEVDEDELQDLIQVVQEVAATKAKEEADAALASMVAAKSTGKIRLKVPGVTGSDELKAAIADVYMQAQIDAQVALEVSRARQLDEEEAIVLLLVN